MKKMHNNQAYEAPVAEMIQLQSEAAVLIGSAAGGGPNPDYPGWGGMIED